MEYFSQFAILPAEIIVRLILMLFALRLEHLQPEWRILLVGFVALIFWGRLLTFVIRLIQQKVFGYYGGEN